MSTIAKDTLKTVRGLLRGKIDPMSYASVQSFESKCYNPPDHIELVMLAVNEVLGGYGVEPINGSWVAPFWHNCRALYVNMGDPYDQTVIYDCHKGKYIVTSWGDFVEHAPKYYGIM